jgi:MFS superfamily sulfate permease-like transporter
VPAALAVSAGGILAIVVLNLLVPLRPGVVVAAVGSTLAVAWLGLEAAGVTLIGDLPRGLPPLTLPTVDWDVLPTLLGGAVAVALVSFADTGALSTATALQAGQRVDPDDEIRALGVSNLLSGLFQGFATSASSSRTAVAMAVGARTQVAGLVAAGGVLVIVVAAPGLVARMPEPTLAAIVIAASLALFDLRGWRWLAAVRRSELFLSLATTAGVLLFGVLEGLGVAIGLAIANFVRRAWRPHATELGIVPGVSGYHDLTRHPEADLVPGLLLLRFDAPLFFANAAEFGRWLEGWLHDTDRPIERVVVVANAMTDVDSTGAEILTEVLDDLDRRGVAFAFAGLKGVVRDRLARYGLVERIGMDAFFPNTISAVEAHTAARDARDAGGADGDTDDRQDGQD